MKKEHADKIITDYLKKIYGFAISKTMDIDLAEELAARITFEAYKSLLKAEKIQNTDGYIYKISRNIYARFVIEEMNGNPYQILGSSKLNIQPIENIQRDEILDKIRTEIAYLSNIQREIILMHYFDKLKLNTIAEKLNLPFGTVAWHLHEARNQIKDGFITHNSQLTTQDYLSPTPNPFPFITMSINGHLGPSNTTMSFYFSKKFTQNIAYSAYYKAKNIAEIAREIKLPTAFVEDKINQLIENGFMKKLANAKVRTDIYIKEKRDNSTDIKILELNKKYAKIVCDIYIPHLFSTPYPLSPTPYSLPPKIYIPENDHNFLLWSLVSFACNCKLSVIDNNNELEKFMIKRKDGGKYIAIATLNSDFQTLNSELRTPPFSPIDTRVDNRIFPFVLWEFISKFNEKTDDCSEWSGFQFESLYRYMTGNLKKEPSNIDTFKLMYDKGLIVTTTHEPHNSKLTTQNSQLITFVNLIITTMKEEEFVDSLPPIPNELIAIGKEFDDEMYKLKKIYFPTHKKELCRILNQNSFTKGHFRTLVLEMLLKRKILKPLKNHQKLTVNKIMFSDVLPKEVERSNE